MKNIIKIRYLPTTYTLIISALAAISACSRLPVTGDDNAGTDSTGTVTTAVNVVDVTSPMTLVSTDNQGTWSFTYAETESVEAGQILVSAKNDGYLISVDSVAGESSITVYGTPATLEDLVTDCAIDTQADLATDSVGFSNIAVTGGNLSGYLSMTPRVGLQLTISGHRVTDFTFSAAGPIKAALVCSSGYSADVSGGNSEASLYNDAVPVVLWIDDVPLLAVLELAVTGTVTGSPLADIAYAGVTTGFTYDGSFQTSVSYDGSSWSASGTCDTTFTAVGTTAVRGISDSLKFRLITRLNCRICNTAGPGLSTAVYGLVQTNSTTGWTAAAGIQTRATVPAGNISQGAGTFTQIVTGFHSQLHTGQLSGNPPAVPVIQTPLNASRDLTVPVYLSWGATVNTDYWIVNITENASYDTVSAPNLTVNDLDPMTKYHWRVQAVNKWGAGAWTATHYFSTTGPAPVTYEPADGEIWTDTMVQFKWSSVSGADNYTLKYGRSADFSSNDVKTLESGGETAVMADISPYLMAAGNGLMLYWTVQAFDDYSRSAWSAVDSFLYQPEQASLIPEPLTPADGDIVIPDSGIVALTWHPVPGSATYDLEIATDSTGSATFAQPIGIPNPRYHASGLPSGTIIYWRVRAVQHPVSGLWSRWAHFKVR